MGLLYLFNNRPQIRRPSSLVTIPTELFLLLHSYVYKSILQCSQFLLHVAFVAHTSSFLLSHCRFYQKLSLTSTSIKIVILHMMEIRTFIPPTVHKSYGNTLQAHGMVLLSPKPIQERTDYLLTPWCRVLPEQLTGLQLVKKFPAFHGTRRFITALTSVRHLSLF